MEESEVSDSGRTRLPIPKEESEAFIRRLKEIIGDDSVSAFATRCRLGESVLRKYFAGSYPRMDYLVAIANTAGVTVEWLATGRGPKTRGNEPTGYAVHDTPADYAAIPLYDVRAAAGGGAVVDREQVVDFLHFKQEWVRTELNASPSDLYLINVDGESMEPTLRPGDIILVDHRDQTQARDGIYVLRMDGTLLVKRLQKLPGGVVNVTSDNPSYKPFTITLSQVGDDFSIIGRVVWSGRRM